jgi:hypothetical protein
MFCYVLCCLRNTRPMVLGPADAGYVSTGIEDVSSPKDFSAAGASSVRVK